MSEQVVVGLCAAHDAVLRESVYILLAPILLGVGISFIQALVWDITLLLVDFMALYLAWAFFYLQALGFDRRRPNDAHCADFGLFGPYALPDPLGATMTTFFVMWGILWACNRPRAITNMVFYVFAVVVLYWLAAIDHDYVTVGQALFAVGESVAVGIVLFLLSDIVIVAIRQEGSLTRPGSRLLDLLNTQ